MIAIEEIPATSTSSAEINSQNNEDESVTISKVEEESMDSKEPNNDDNHNVPKFTKLSSTITRNSHSKNESITIPEIMTEEEVSKDPNNEESRIVPKITELPSPSTSSAETNSEKRNSQNFEDDSITVSEIMIEEPNNEENCIIPKIEDISSSSVKDSDDEDKQSETEHDEYDCITRNIIVKNSSDVYFGNKTHYQYEGPVVIKQYVRGAKNEDDREMQNENGGRDNLAFEQEPVNHRVENRGQVNSAFVPETVIQTDEDYTKRDQNREVPNVAIVNEEDTHNKTESSEGTNWLYIRNKRKLIAICVSFIIVIIIILITSLVNKQSNDTVPPPLWREESNLSGKLKIINRNEWLAEPPDYKLDALSLPVPNIIIAHTVTESCANRGECTDIVRYIQHYHAKDLGWSDIGYSFLVGGDGYVYEGRGWKTVGAHTFKWNTKSIGIAFIGSFEDNLPPKHQILAAKMLIEQGVKDKYLSEDYKLYGHLQVGNLRSPGEVFFEDIKTWPHWTNRSYVSNT